MASTLNRSKALRTLSALQIRVVDVDDDVDVVDTPALIGGKVIVEVAVVLVVPAVAVKQEQALLTLTEAY